MSAQPKTSDDLIREAARQLLEGGGVESISMQSVASAVGIQAPSLYKRFASKTDLLASVTDDALKQLQGLIESCVSPTEPKQSLQHMAAVYRSFAKGNPHTYQLIFAPTSTSNLDAWLRSAAPLLEVLKQELGANRALPAARTLVAFLHGFVSMELNGSFQFGGNIDGAFEFGLATILNALMPMAGPL